jgi:hypothetical protein
MTTADRYAPARGINVKKRTDSVAVRDRLMPSTVDFTMFSVR